MNNLQKIALEKAISFLKAGKFIYAIMDENGNKWGELPILEKNRKRAKSKYPHGAVREHYKHLIENMKKDDGVAIPFGNFPPLDLQSNICSWAAVNWGAGTYSTAIDKESNSVLVFRIG